MADQSEGDYKYAPPPWFQEGLAVLDARGQTCKSLDETRFTYPADPKQGERVETRGVECQHPIPRAVRLALGGNPAALYEQCFGEARDVVGAPYGMASATPEEERYLCGITANPGTDAAPNTATWFCGRAQYRTSRFGTDIPPDWTAQRTKLFPGRKYPTLQRCLAPRVHLAGGTAKGVRATCSHACTVTLSLTPRSASRVVARGTKRLRYARQTTVPVRGESPSGAVSVRVRVDAAGATETVRLAATSARGRITIRRTIIDVGS
jgi:hypothetical protein